MSLCVWQCCSLGSEGEGDITVSLKDLPQNPRKSRQCPGTVQHAAADSVTCKLLGHSVREASVIKREEKPIIYHREGFGVRWEGSGFWCTPSSCETPQKSSNYQSPLSLCFPSCEMGITLPHSQWPWAGLALVQHVLCARSCAKHVTGPTAFSSDGSQTIILIFQMGKLRLRKP